jgi:membrane-bound serine protease (ClpP class)
VELNLPWDVSFELGYVQEMFWRVAWSFLLSLVAVGAGLAFLLKLLSRGKLGRQLVLQSATSTTQGYVSEPPGQSALLGKRGTLLTALRPAGMALIDGQRVDVVSEGEFFDKGLDIEVTHVDGNRVVVRRVGPA